MSKHVHPAPRTAGRGDRRRRREGARVDDCLMKAKVSSLAPPPPRYARSPSPASLRSAGADESIGGSPQRDPPLSARTDTNDNTFIGATWVFVWNGSAWVQQGGKLVGSNPFVNEPRQGGSLGISGDGNTAIIGAGFQGDIGAWIFTRSSGVWSQSGGELAGVGMVSQFSDAGPAVAISSDATTAAIGRWWDGHTSSSPATGAVWPFTRSAAPRLIAAHDFNGNGLSDIAWRDNNGNTAAWLMNGSQVASAGSLGLVPGWSIVGQRDFDGDGNADLLWRDGGGDLALWLMNGLAVSSNNSLGNVPPNWTVSGSGDLNRDGDGDILWRDTNSGTVAAWLMNGVSVGPPSITAWCRRPGASSATTTKATFSGAIHPGTWRYGRSTARR